jgi:hypothetical protein
VTGLVEASPASILALFDQDVPSIRARRIDAGTSTIREVAITARDFVPTEHYHRSVCHAALAFASGDVPTLEGADVALP